MMPDSCLGTFGPTWILQRNGLDLQRIPFEESKQPAFLIDDAPDRGPYRVVLDFGTLRPRKRFVRVSAEFSDSSEADSRRGHAMSE